MLDELKPTRDSGLTHHSFHGRRRYVVQAYAVVRFVTRERFRVVIDP